MIGGTDIVLQTHVGPESLGTCARVVRRYWPKARFEDAITGEKYERYADLPIGSLRELLIYPDASAEASWDVESPDSPPNSMIYLLFSAGSLTTVVDDPGTAEMRSILESMRIALGAEILNPEAEFVLPGTHKGSGANT